MLLVTQHIDEIFPEVSRVVVLREGRIIDDGPKDEVLRGPALAAAFGGPLRVTCEEGYYYVRRPWTVHVIEHAIRPTPVCARAMLVLRHSTLLSGAELPAGRSGQDGALPAGPLTFGAFTATFPADRTFTIVG